MKIGYWLATVGLLHATGSCATHKPKAVDGMASGGSSASGGDGGSEASGGSSASGDSGGSGGAKGGASGSGGTSEVGGSGGTSADAGAAGADDSMSQAGSGDGSDLPGDMLEDGSREIDQGPPGSVGNRCIDDWACDMDLVCSVSRYCQPFLSDLPPQIVQAVPTPDSAHIPASAPIMFFADGTGFAVTFSVTAYTLEDTIDITDDVSLVTLTSGAGKDVYVLAPRSGYPLGASIAVTFSGDLVGSAVFNVDHDAPPFAEGQLDFEGDPNPELECTSSVGATSLPIGWTGFGDVGVISETGSIVPTSGTNAMVMTTGAALCGAALSETSSMIVSGPIRGLGDSPSLTFDYNFQSSEFDDYCQTDYDDTLLAVLSGPEGAVATVVDSVNLVCDEGTHVDAEFPTMPDAGDSIYKETGNTVFGLEGPVGSPAVLAFVLTDVQDADLSSVVSIDNIVDTN